VFHPCFIRHFSVLNFSNFSYPVVGQANGALGPIMIPDRVTAGFDRSDPRVCVQSMVMSHLFQQQA
jgi:hypothetical protein